MAEIPKVEARVMRFSPGGPVVCYYVTCPYCGKLHRHLPGGEMRRMADCFKGEYVLEANDER